MYLVQYLRNNTTAKVPGPGPIAKFVDHGPRLNSNKGGKKRSNKNKKNIIHIVSRSTYYYNQK